MSTKQRDTPLLIGMSTPKRKTNRYNEEMKYTIERALTFSGVKYHWIQTSISPNTDTLAPVRTVEWKFFAYELASPVIHGWQKQTGPHSNLKVLEEIARQLAEEKATDGVRFKFWLWRTWAQLTTEAE